MADNQTLIGVDVGGSGVKAASVDLGTGEAVGRERIPTPQPATPDAIASTINTLLGKFPVGGPVGCTLPAVVTQGTVRTAAHIDGTWIGTDGAAVIGKVTGRECVVLNDADAAGLAEARYGAARDNKGLVVLVTIGTGVGTAVINNGVLVPNSELGHIEVGNNIADTWVSDSVRDADDLSWKKWSHRFNSYLTHMHSLLWPDLFLVGGGIVKHGEKFMDRLDPGCEVKLAELGNLAGIVGAAVAAAEKG